MPKLPEHPPRPRQPGGARETGSRVCHLGTSVLEPDLLQGCGGCGWRSLSPAAQPGSPAGAGGRQRERKARSRRPVPCPALTLSPVCLSSFLSPPPRPWHQLSPAQEAPRPSQLKATLQSPAPPIPRSAAWSPGAPESSQGKLPITLHEHDRTRVPLGICGAPTFQQAGAPPRERPNPEICPGGAAFSASGLGSPEEPPGRGPLHPRRSPPRPPVHAPRPRAGEKGSGTHAEGTWDRGAPGDRPGGRGDGVGGRAWAPPLWGPCRFLTLVTGCLPVPPLSPSPDRRKTLPTRRPQGREVRPSCPLQRARRAGSPRRGLAGATRRRRGPSRDNTCWGPAGRGAL